MLVVCLQSFDANLPADLTDVRLFANGRAARTLRGCSIFGVPLADAGDVDGLVLDDGKFDNPDLKLGWEVVEAERVRGLCTRACKLVRCPRRDLLAMQYLPLSPLRKLP